MSSTHLAEAEDRRLRLAHLRKAVAATSIAVAAGYKDEADLWERTELADAEK